MAEPATWPEEKRCSHCKHLKPAAEFYARKGNRDGLSSWCKACTSARDKRPDVKARRYAYKKTAAGREAERRSHLKCQFNLTVEQYDRLLATQAGVCAICKHGPAKNKRLAVDHDHSCCPGAQSCGRCIRGLLCQQCNHKILGYWLHEGVKGTDQALVTARSLVAYLERSQDARTERSA